MSPPPDPLPTYIYKIIPTAPPSPLPASYPLSELDQADGFVHLSTAAQIPTTAGLFFAETSQLWVIKIHLAGFEDRITWTESGRCPHLYGNFGAAEIQDVRCFVRSDSQSWAEAMETEDAWLEWHGSS